MMLAVEKNAVKASECGRDLVEVSDEKSALAALLAARKWLRMNDLDMEEAYVRLSFELSDNARICPRCKGDGRVMHPSWREWHAAHSNLKGWEYTEELDRTAPREREEITCHLCNGTGRVLNERGRIAASLIHALARELNKIEGRNRL